MDSGNLGIGKGQPRDPEYWANLAEIPGSQDPEINMDIRAMMTAVALLHQEHPHRHCFSKEEVWGYIPRAMDMFPILKELQ